MKHRIKVLTEDDIAKMDAKRKPRDFFAFVRELEADLSRFPTQTGKLSSVAEKRREAPLELLESTYNEGR